MATLSNIVILWTFVIVGSLRSPVRLETLLQESPFA